MRTKPIFALLALGTAALGAGCSSTEEGHRPPPPSLLMTTLDANHDGIIDAQEIANSPAALKTLDLNGDGRLTWDELRPHPPEKVDGYGANGAQSAPLVDTKEMGPDKQGMTRPRHRLPGPLMFALDANHDGVIDAQEIANAPAELKTLDRNGDGRLTPDELRPPHPPKRRHHEDEDGDDMPPRPPMADN